ncbi:MAG: hypothetical protein Kow0031_04190 [Anaerolineae bacterium]
MLLALILLLAAGLRFYCLNCQSLWADEGNSAVLVQAGFAEIAQRTAFDIHPPLYYWLLKLWVTLFGSGEAALRSLSALLGVGLVALTWDIGRRLFSSALGLVAALVTALSPLLVYYSQEARMYMLLAFLSTLTVLLAVEILSGVRSEESESSPKISALLYILAVTAGLYTHYAYPVILLAVNLTALLHFVRNSQLSWRSSHFLRWLGLQLVPLLLYLPWLPTAWRQLTTWPAEGFPPPLPEMASNVGVTLLLGLSWPHLQTGLVVMVLAVVLGIPALFFGLDMARVQLRFPRAVSLLYLWLLLPLLLTLYIYSPAFLKFLVVAVPPLALLLALTVGELVRITDRRWLGLLLGGLLLAEVSATSLVSLRAYYTDPAFARDNYRAIAQFIRAVAGPGDAVILNAEGQQDVFGYYYPANSAAAPVYPLPRRRPLSREETVAELAGIAASSDSVYTVYWAQQQADPAGLIERWLNENLFKATDRWFGNVRLVSYASPQAGIEPRPFAATLGDGIRLVGMGLGAGALSPGDIVQVALQWQVDAPPADDLTVFLQLLDAGDNVVGQRDAPPRLPAPEWPAGRPVDDAHGLFIEPGTPPGSYRLIGGLYHSQSGQRLPVANTGADFVELTQIEVASPDAPLPPEAFSMGHQLGEELAGLRLLGYNLYKLGHRSEPDTPLRPGDPLHLDLYWQRGDGAAAPPDRVTVSLLGQAGAAGPALTLSLGGEYPPAQWRPGEVVRAQGNLFLSDVTPGQYRLEFAVDNPATGQKETARSEPFTVN